MNKSKLFPWQHDDLWLRGCVSGKWVTGINRARGVRHREHLKWLEPFYKTYKSLYKLEDVWLSRVVER